MVDKPNVKWKELVLNLDAIDDGLCNDTEIDDQRRETKWTELLRIMRPLLDQGLRRRYFQYVNKTAVPSWGERRYHYGRHTAPFAIRHL